MKKIEIEIWICWKFEIKTFKRNKIGQKKQELLHLRNLMRISWWGSADEDQLMRISWWRSADEDQLMKISWWGSADEDQLMRISWWGSVDEDQLMRTSWWRLFFSEVGYLQWWLIIFWNIWSNLIGSFKSHVMMTSLVDRYNITTRESPRTM